MTIRYQLTENDYVQAGKLHSKLTRKFKIILLLLSIVFILAATLDTGTLRFAAQCGLVGLASWTCLTYLTSLFLPYTLKRNYRNHKTLHNAEITVDIVEGGLYCTSPTGSGTILFEHILKWRQNQGYVLVYLAPNLYQIIPKHSSNNLQ